MRNRMKTSHDIDHGTLSWVRQELDGTLREAAGALDRFAGDPDDPRQLQTCLANLHQVHGIVQMLELHGATMLAEEMEALGGSLIEGRTPAFEQGTEALMRAILQLRDYLERVDSGQHDAALLILRLINDLRAAHGQAIIAASALFNADLDAVPESPRYPRDEDGDFVGHPAATVSEYQRGLLGYFRARLPARALERMAAAMETLDRACATEAEAAPWWIASGFFDAAAAGELDAHGAAIRGLGARIERHLRAVARGAEASPLPPAVQRGLLYYLARVEAPGECVRALQDHYGLRELLHEERRIEEAREGLFGPGADTLRTVADAISEDVAAVKDTLDLYSRGSARDGDELQGAAEAMGRIADTLGILGLAAPRRAVAEQAELLDRLAAGEGDEGPTVDRIAETLLYVDASLADLVAGQAAAADAAGDPEAEMLESEFRHVYGAAIEEAIAEVGAVKEAIVQFLESHDGSHLAGLDQRFAAVRGALDVVELPRASALIAAAERYVTEELRTRSDIPPAEALDDLADAITGVEYYLEAMRDRRGGSDHVLGVVANSLRRLGYAPEGDAAEAAGEPSADPPAPETAEPVAPAMDFSRKRGRVELGVAARGADVDEEILEIFIEEADEILESLGEVFPRWRTNPEDQDALTTCRRLFHTLKGSGRLAGALLLGELAWAVENLLNRILDRTLPFDPEIPDLVDEVIGVVPGLVGELRGDPAPEADIRALMRRAILLAGDEVVEAEPERSTPATGASTTPADTAVVTDSSPEPTDTAPPIDPVLYDIFSRETADHLAVIEGFVELCDAQAGACRVDENLVRSLHTLTGSARMAEVRPIAELGRALEDLARARQNANRPLSVVGRELLRRGAATVRDVVAALGEGGSALPAVDALADEVRAAVREGTPPPSLEALAWPEEEEEHDGADDSRADDGAGDPAWVDHPAGRGEMQGAAMPRPEAEGEPGRVEPEPSEYPIAKVDGAVAAHPAVTTAGATALVPEPASEADPDPEMEEERAPAAAEQSEEADVDDGLAAIFLEEAEEILEFLDGTLARWEDSQEHHKYLAELHRALHTLKGGARLAGFDGIGRLCHQLESLADDVVADRVPADDTFFDLLRDSLDAVQALVEGARRGDDDLDPAPELLARIEAGRGARGPEGAPGGPGPLEDAPDEELVEVFLEEAAEILASAEQLLHGWRQAPDDATYVDEMQRVLHTLKGGARMVGYHPIGDLSHALETALRRVSEERAPVTPALLDVLDSVNDELIQLRDNAQAGAPLVQPSALIEALEQVTTTPQRTESSVEGAVQTVTAPAERREPAAEPAPAGDAGRRQADAVRVRADLLDGLVNYAGEVSIYRARIEQQTGAVDFNLTELDQTVARLRAQLRTLEIETEAQILYRFEREQETEPDQYGEDFDPLEMDRFSRMQEVSRALSESVSDLSSIQNTLADLNRETETLLLQQSRVNTDLQDGLMRTRMVPFANLVPRMRRIVRQAGQELGKQASLRVLGAQSGVDRSVLDRITAPLEHMLRNAVAHGIETPEARAALGKPEAGSISIALTREGADVIIRVVDDGAGLDLDAIRQKAADRGLMPEDADLTDREIMQFVLEAGFSTAEQVTQIAGRGVGMDVVNAEIKQLGGSLEIDSEAGVGTRFTVRLPFTLALNHALICRAGDEVYALPLSSIEGVVRLDADELAARFASEDEPVYEYSGYRYSLRSLAAVLGAPPVVVTGDQRRLPLVLVQAGDHRMALQVEGLLGSRDIVVKSVGAQLSSLPGVPGATILADGRVGLVLDVSALVRFGVAGARATLPAPEQRQGNRPVVMVVDDSITMRKVAARLLERNHIEAITAKDGVDAVARLQDRVPDAILLDIEMPRMDGYEFATLMRNDERFRGVPIVMITSRTGDKHRERALQIGVDRYLGKPYQEAELLTALRELIAQSRTRGGRT